MRMSPGQFGVIRVAGATFLGKVNAKPSVININVEAEVGYVGMAAAWRAILVVNTLIILVSRLLSLWL